MMAPACRLTAALGIIAGIFQASQTSAEVPDAAVSLSLSRPVERSFSADEVHSYVIELSPGYYLLNVDQAGLDLRVTVSSDTTIVVDSPSHRDDRETALLHVLLPSEYTITIDSDEYTGTTANYSIDVRPLDDPTLIAAQRLMTDAASANEQGGKENWRRALVAYRAALDLWRQTEVVAEQARTLYNIAFLQYWQFFSWQEAADSAAKAADLYEADGQTALAANARHLQAASLIEAANDVGTEHAATKADAESIFQAALNLFETVADTQTALDRHYDHAHTINNIGLTHFYRDDLVRARSFFAQAAQEFRRLDEWSGEMIALANLAVIDHEKGRLSNAAETYERLLELLPADREITWRADTLDNLATTRLLLGETDAALQRFLAALKLHEQMDDTKGLGRSVAGIGSTYVAIGEIELARDYLERSLELRRQANDGKGEVADLRNLANVHRMLGELEVSLEYHKTALELATSPLERARVLVQQARDWIDTGEIARATAVLEEAREAAESEGAMRILADAAYESGRAYYRGGESELAERWLHRAHDLYSTIGLRAGQAQSLLALARQVSEDSLDSAIAYGLEAVDLIEELRSNVADLELRAVYLGGRATYYEFLINVLMRASTTASTDSAAMDFVRRALEVSERARARATVDLINEAAIDFTQTVDHDILARQAALDRRLIETTYRRDNLLEQNARREAIQEVVAELQAIHTELDVLEAEARDSSSRYSELSEPEVLDAVEMQGMLDDDTVVLQYALGDDASFLWMITRDSIRPAALPRRSTINTLARKVYEGLAVPMPQVPAARQRQADIDELSATIIGSVSGELGQYQRIIVAADGALQYVPFSVLSVDGRGALNESHDLIVIPSLTAVARQHEIRKEQATPSKTLAIIGDPVFDESDSRLSATATNKKPAVQGSLPGTMLTKHSRLPFSGHEVDQIASLVGENERLVATGFEASKVRVAGSHLRDYRYVHFATHGIIDSSQPALSTLLLSMRDPKGAAVDGYFRLRDIYSLELNADVVVLSACDTALGRQIRGEGLIGMTQGFLYAGAAQIVASLWQVPDRATAELMTFFYKRILEGHQSPVAALRGAQRDLAQRNLWRDPYFWSGFVVQGDWR